jgi:ferredoxin
MTIVWIEDSCTSCSACVVACPTVFTLVDGDSMVRGETRTDGRTDANRETRSALRADVAAAEADALAEAADACPVDIIRIED